MILTLFKLKALAAKAKELRQTLQSLAAQMKMGPGCESVCVYQQVEDESDFLLIGAWKNREALNDHLQSIHFTVVMGARSLLRRPPEIMIHTVAQSAQLSDVQSKIPVMGVMAQEAGKQAEAFAKAGRHAPCPCGSGRAFKTCHGRDGTDTIHAGTERKT
jgi:quinol monooxygenase YgiN